MVLTAADVGWVGVENCCEFFCVDLFWVGFQPISRLRGLGVKFLKVLSITYWSSIETLSKKTHSRSFSGRLGLAVHGGITQILEIITPFRIYGLQRCYF
jgi:hypothetical protein